METKVSSLHLIVTVVVLIPILMILNIKLLLNFNFKVTNPNCI